MAPAAASVQSCTSVQCLQDCTSYSSNPTTASVFRKISRPFHLLYFSEKTLQFGDLCMVTRCRETSTGKRRVCKSYYKRDLSHFDACSSFVRQTYRRHHREDQEEDQISIVARVIREAEIMASLRGAHPHLLASTAAYESDEAYHIVMDFCEQGTLSDKVKQLAYPSYNRNKLCYPYYCYTEPEEDQEEADSGLLPEEEAVRIFRELAQAVLFLHEDRKIAHRDIKCDNVFLRHDGSVQLGDFGLAASCSLPDGSPRVFHDFVGSMHYMAPEVLRLAAHRPELDDNYMDAVIGYDAQSADVWSMGVVLYHMLTGGAYPYESIDDGSVEELYEAMTSDQIMWSAVVENYGPLAKDLVSWMLCQDPHRRPSIQQVLLHPWLSQKELWQHEQMIDTEEENYAASPPPSSSECCIVQQQQAKQQHLDSDRYAIRSHNVHRSKKDQKPAGMRWQQHTCMKDKLYSIIKKKAACSSCKLKKHNLPDSHSAQRHADHLNMIRHKYGMPKLISCNTAAFMSASAAPQSTPSPAAPHLTAPPAAGAVVLTAC